MVVNLTKPFQSQLSPAKATSVLSHSNPRPTESPKRRSGVSLCFWGTPRNGQFSFGFSLKNTEQGCPPKMIFPIWAVVVAFWFQVSFHESTLGVYGGNSFWWKSEV